MQTVLGTDPGQDTIIDDNQGRGIRRTTAIMADNIGVPASIRGTTQPLYLKTYMYKGETGDLSVDGGTSLIADIEFNEGVV